MDTGQLTFDPACALPAESYREAAWFAAEKENIWHGDWVFVTTEDALPAAGDQLPAVVGDQPVLLLRNQAEELAALSNLCAHRGTLLVEQPTNADRIQCPYHAWTYDTAGHLLGVPFAPADAIDKAAHHLPSYRVESWHGLVFVSLNPGVEPLAERFAEVEPLVSEYGIDGLHHQSDQQTTDVWECNWKVAMQNAMESYHLFKVHPETLQPITPTNGAYYITGSARAAATGGTYKGQDDYLLISLPPAFVGVFFGDGFFWQAVHPIDTHRCTVRTGGAYALHQRAGVISRLSEWLSWGFVEQSPLDFLSEDKAICERIQRGITGHFTPGRLVPLERVVADFGHYLNWRLNDVEPPPVHSQQPP